jgi:hypothetical protein
MMKRTMAYAQTEPENRDVNTLYKEGAWEPVGMTPNVSMFPQSSFWELDVQGLKLEAVLFHHKNGGNRSVTIA